MDERQLAVITAGFSDPDEGYIRAKMQLRQATRDAVYMSGEIFRLGRFLKQGDSIEYHLRIGLAGADPLGAATVAVDALAAALTAYREAAVPRES